LPTTAPVTRSAGRCSTDRVEHRDIVGRRAVLESRDEISFESLRRHWRATTPPIIESVVVA